MIKAKDVMTTRVVTLVPDATIGEASRLFEQAGISGAPVVGPGRKLLGVLSRTDIVRHHDQARRGEVPAFYQEGGAVLFTTPVASPGDTRVAEVMTPAVLTALEDTPVEELARFMVGKRIHRVVIVRDGVLRGIVTAMDLLALLSWPRRAASVESGRRSSGPPLPRRRGRRPAARRPSPSSRGRSSRKPG